ncbi:SDR family oxidoreductase [Cellulomonas sp. HZM]|uniref:SDR family oxidoreductase n=1 Tax=Cellulomonas sp. HZM TaxID=1454010 RepID=UPI000493103D|nr:SDR family oxidoreductase [Cellulomonas sp. HZM]
MDLGLEGRLAVVTGASKGIGLAVTRTLVREGVRVVAGARTRSADLDALVSAGTVLPVEVDLSTPDGPATLVAAALELGSVDLLVNNVGAVTPRVDGFLAVTDDEWAATINLSLMAAVRATRAVLPSMLDAGGGSVVTISSVNAFLPDPDVIDYGAAKAALTNFSKALSKQVGPRGVRLNTISPGPVATDLWLGEHGVAATVGLAAGSDPAAVSAAAAGQSVTGRFTRPQEIAELVAFLASDVAANVTGADFVIDGGLTTQT